MLIADNVQIVAASVDDSEIGDGAILDPGSEVAFAVLGERVRVERGASVVGGRNIDTLVVGADAEIGAGASVRGRGLGAGSVIGPAPPSATAPPPGSTSASGRTRSGWSAAPSATA